MVNAHFLSILFETFLNHTHEELQEHVRDHYQYGTPVEGNFLDGQQVGGQLLC